jgi:hypothetical protein
MTRKQLLLTIMLAAAGSIPLTAQNQSPTNDPTEKSPSTVAPPPSPQALPDGNQTGDAVKRSPPTPKSTDHQSGRKFVGTIVKKRHAYVLQAADREYLLSDHEKAKKYAGKRVKVTGDSNENSVIRVEAIQLSPE